MAWDEQFARFLLGTSPKAFHLPYLDVSYVDVKKHRGPSSSIGVTLCAAVVGMETLRLLSGWAGVRPAPDHPSMTRGVENGTKDTSGGRTDIRSKVKTGHFSPATFKNCSVQTISDPPPFRGSPLTNAPFAHILNHRA